MADYGREGKVDPKACCMATWYTQNGVKAQFLDVWSVSIGGQEHLRRGLPLAPDAPRAEVTGEGVTLSWRNSRGSGGSPNTFILQTNGKDSR